MQLEEMIHKLNLVILTEPEKISDIQPSVGYASDMLSCVMSAAKHNSLWVTIQSHLNIIAVASLLDLSAIIITEGNIPEAAVIQKANQENVTLLSTPESTFHVAGKLWELGVRT